MIGGTQRRGADLPAGSGKLAARRAVIRWAWRLFRREWRQQVLITGLVALAVAATIVGAAVATNSPPPVTARFGSALDRATFAGSDPHLAPEISALHRRFGQVDVIDNETLPIPGSVATYQLRAQDPHGAFGRPLLSLVAGHYPKGVGQVAMTSQLASEFHVGLGALWRANGTPRRVVGIVENPDSLLESFALVVPGQVTSPTEATVLFDAPGVAPFTIGSNVTGRDGRTPQGAFNPETISLAGLTMGMLLIALVAIGGFTVLAHRRLRSLGALAAQGATPGNVGLVVRANGAIVGAVGAVTGVAAGIGLWLAYRPHLEQSSHHLIGVLALPWIVVGLAVGLAVIATFIAAVRPARAIAKVPIVAALSGRPVPPRQVHRSALPGVACFVVAFFLLGISGSTSSPGLLVLGLGMLVPGVILLSPFALSLVARAGRRGPVAIRLALRDLDRYRARSGAALAAISIGILISAVISIAASARYGNVLDYAGPNLGPNQLVLYTAGSSGPRVFLKRTSAGFERVTGQSRGGGPGPTANTPSVATMQSTAHGIASSIGAGRVIALEATSARLTRDASGRNFTGPVYVATPALLRSFGIRTSQVNPNADVLTMRPGLSSITKMRLTWVRPPLSGPIGAAGNRPNSTGPPPCTLAGDCLANPVIEEVPALPAGTSAPNTVITEHAVHQFHLTTTVAGWLIQTARPLSAIQTANARQRAAAVGMTIETKNDAPTSAAVVNWATVFGIALELAILAMSVGLIRSETAADLRTLTATGATSTTRRTLAAATAGALAFLGAVLGTIAAYVGMIGWIRSSGLNGGISALANAPVANLALIVVGMPLVAAAAGWLLGGREPSALAHRPID